MTEFAEIPDRWSEIEYKVGESLSERDNTETFEARWASEDDKISITARHSVDADGSVTYPVVVEQTLDPEDREFSTIVQSHARVEDDREMAENVAAGFMHEVQDGMHKIRLLGVEEWKEFYQFYCISDSELPGEMTGEEIIDSLDNEQYNEEIDDLPDDFDPGVDAEKTVQIDVFPRHKSEINKEKDNE